MSDIVGISGSVADSYTNTTVSNGSMDKDDFLELLVTQLQYQDPLEPMDNTAMAAQLAQYSSLETLNNIQETLENSLLLDQSLNNSFMTSLIGKGAKAYGNGVTYSGENTDLSYETYGAANVTINVYDESGDLVRTIDAGYQQAGEHSFTWDGRDDSGQTVDSGHYTFKVDALNSDGDAVTAYTYTVGMIQGVTYIGGSPYFLINGQEVNLGDVISILDSMDDGTIVDPTEVASNH